MDLKTLHVILRLFHKTSGFALRPFDVQAFLANKRKRAKAQISTEFSQRSPVTDRWFLCSRRSHIGLLLIKTTSYGHASLLFIPKLFSSMWVHAPVLTRAESCLRTEIYQFALKSLPAAATVVHTVWIIRVAPGDFLRVAPGGLAAPQALQRVNDNIAYHNTVPSHHMLKINQVH